MIKDVFHLFYCQENLNIVLFLIFELLRRLNIGKQNKNPFISHLSKLEVLNFHPPSPLTAVDFFDS